jgi:hypothetical protein
MEQGQRQGEEYDWREVCIYIQLRVTLWVLLIGPTSKAHFSTRFGTCGIILFETLLDFSSHTFQRIFLLCADSGCQ